MAEEHESNRDFPAKWINWLSGSLSRRLLTAVFTLPSHLDKNDRIFRHISCLRMITISLIQLAFQ
jgi:hypothetical protein